MSAQLNYTICLLLTITIAAIASIVSISCTNKLPSRNMLCQIATTQKTYSCHIGKNGITTNKREGDGATPAGSFPIREIFYRPDKLSQSAIIRLQALSKKGFPVHALTPNDGWSDDPRSLSYNKHILITDYLKEPIPNLSYEKLWREDDVYNIIAVIGYNDDPVVKGKGSAIFMHIQRVADDGNIVPTVGCISFAPSDLIDVLSALSPQTRIQISAKSNIIVFR